MRKLLRLTAIILVFGSILFIRPMQVSALGPFPVSYATECKTLATNPDFSGLVFNFGYRVDNTTNGTFRLEFGGGGTITGEGQPSDANNSFTLSGDATSFNWTSTLSMDAVIVKSATSAFAYYYNPEESGSTNLEVGGTGQAITSIEVCFDYELKATTTINTSWEKKIDWSVTKGASAASVAAFAGAAPELTYTVGVSKIEELGPFNISGTVAITNPSPSAFNFTISVASSVPPLTVSCPKLSMVGYETVNCTITGAPANNNPGTSTAVITTQQTHVRGTTSTQGYEFGAATLKAGSDPEGITVTDSLKGVLGTYSSNTTIPYASTKVCSTDPLGYSNGSYSETVTNIASINSFLPESASVSVSLTCYAPLVSKTAKATAYKTVDWTISKSVSPASQDRLAGESATFGYTINLVKGEESGPNIVDGTITVTNPVGAPGNMSVSVSDNLGGAAASVDCNPALDGNQPDLSVPSGASRTCTYTGGLASAVDGTNTATVSLNGVSFTADAAYAFTGPVVLNPNSEPDSVTVADSYAGSFGPYSDDFTITYSRPAACPATSGAYSEGMAVVNLTNTAEINETADPAAGAPATLNCYAPVVSKSADARFTELHTWTLTKVADPALQSALAGQTARYTWQIGVIEAISEQDPIVSGTIQVVNPGPLAMTVVLSDALNDNTQAAINSCTNGTLTGSSLTIAANTTASCAYSAAPAGRNATTNIATATLNGIPFTANASLTWAADALNASVTLDDDQNPAFPLVISEGGSYSYADTYICPTNPSMYTVGKYSFGESNTVTLNAGNAVLATTSADAAVDCYAPLLSKTASASYTEQHDWTLTKNVSPALQSAFAGESVNFTWAIDVAEDTYDKDFVVTGQISVVNPAPLAMTVSLSDTLSDNTPAVIGPCTNGSFANGSLTISANTTAVCNYTAEPSGRTALANTATLNLNGYTVSSSLSFTWAATLVDPSVTLNDDQNPDLPLTLSAPASITYRETYPCPVVPGVYVGGLAAFSESNTATLTLPSGGAGEVTATALVQVNCFAPVVSKTASAAYTAAHSWTLDKTVSPANQKAIAGASVPFTWTVTVGHQAIETGFLVTGQITIFNPSGEAMHVDLSDSLGDGTQATIQQSAGCTIANGKLTIPSTSTAVCSYTISPPDRIAETNTAVVLLNGVEFAYGLALDWTPTATNPMVILDDERNPAFPIELTEGGVFTYTETPACSTDPANYVDGFFTFAALNSATLSLPVQNGGGVIATDSAIANVECYAPLVSKTAAGTTYKGINWFITKTADQPTAAGLAGGSATLGYTLTLIKQLESELHLVEGEITISSPAGAPDPMPLSVTDLVVPTGLSTVPATVDCDPLTQGNQADLSLASGETRTCTYTAGLASPTSGTNTAFVGLPPQTNGQGVYFSATVDYIFGAADLSKSEPETITVHDSMAGDLGTFSESNTLPYTAEAACPTDPSAYQNGPAVVNVANTARINETFNDESSASVQLTCYAPTLSKTAVATAYKSVNWSIAKSAQQSEYSAFAGQNVTFDYRVTLTKDETSGLNIVQGVISVSSPAGSPTVMALSVTDLVQPTGLGPVAAAVDCDLATGGNQPTLTLAAGASAECTYYAELPSATNGVNTVTANLNGVALTFEKDFAFGEQVDGVTEPGTVTVTDELVGQTWTFSQGGFQDYAYTAACPTDQAAYANNQTPGKITRLIRNTARINETQDAPVSADVVLNCFAPLVSKTASAAAYESIDWTLDKVGIQPPSGGFAGGVVAFDYLLTATRLNIPGPFLVSGEISLANPAGAPGALTLSVTDVLAPDGQPAVPVTADCRPQTAGDQMEVTLGPGESAACAYTVELSGPFDGSNTATILFSPPSGGDQGGGAFTASAGYAFGTPVRNPDSEPETITVIDGPDAWTTSVTQTFNLTRPQACPANTAGYTDGFFTTPVNNTATIFETGDSDSATLDLECYVPLVSKTASAAAFTSLDWTLTKTASLASASLFAGQGIDVEYTLDLALGEVAGPNLVQGEINVTNPNPAAGIVVSVADMTSGIPAAVDCDPLVQGDQATLAVPAGGTGVCTYLAHLPEPVDGTNTATVTLPPLNPPQNGGEVRVTASASYQFGLPQPSPISEPVEVKITDSLGGTFGPFTAAATIQYTSPAVCPVDAAAYQDGVYTGQVSNTAMVLTADGRPLTGLGNQAEAVVDLTCYAPVVSKSASATWTKTIDWTLTKTVAPLSADLLAGETADFAYTLALTKNETPGAYLVSGAVSLANPAGAPGALTMNVTDVLAPVGQPAVPVTADCQPQTEGFQAEVTLEPGESAECTYTVELTGPFDGVNTATILFSPPTSPAPPEGGVSYAVSTPYAFGAAELTPGSEPEMVTLVDTFEGQAQNLGSFRLGDEVTYPLTLGCPADQSVYVDGVYSFTRTNTAMLTNAAGELPTGDEAEATVTVNCTLPGSPAEVIKVIDQGSQAIGQFPITFALYPPGAAEPVETLTLAAVDVTGDGLYTLPFQTLVTAGIWTVQEQLPDGWQTEQTSCTLEVPEVVASGQVFSCILLNTEYSRLRLLKTTNGQVDPSRDWRFVVRPSPPAPSPTGGEGDSDSSLGDADGWLDFGGANLDPAQAYTVCELGSVKNWASVWSAGGVILPGYTANGAHCVDIGAGTSLPLQPGEVLALEVNNVSTRGAPGSSGYWKNSDELEELLSRYTFTIGKLRLGAGDGPSAVLLLDQRDLGTGKKMSSDAFYQLAAELFVYRLNQAKGACVRPEAEAAADSAQALLTSLNFNGRGAYVRNPDATLKAGALAKYNNGSCGK